MRPIPSLSSRYFYKLASNIFTFVTSALMQAIVPRSLGPKSYGDFTFLSNFFTQVGAFCETGTPICFYTKFSQRPKDLALVAFYSYFTLINFAFLIAAIFILVHFDLYKGIWIGQDAFYIYLAVGLSILVRIVPFLNNMADAYGITVSAEKIKIIQRAIAVVLVFSLYVFGTLNLANFFYYQYLVNAILIASLFYIMRRSGFFMKRDFLLDLRQITGYVREFYAYSYPLFTYGIICLIGNLFDRWLLQKYGGSIEQGFFGFSYQIGAICFIFASAMSTLITREFTIAYGNKNLNEVARIFRRYIPLFYSITAFFACFIAVEAKSVIYIFGGNAYSNALLAVTIMAFYPIHQTYGQLSSSFFYASGKTKLYRNIGIVILLAGIPLTFFLIAPRKYDGLNLGAVGLAIKYIALQFFHVNIELFFNSKIIGFSFWKYFLHQLVCVGVLTATAFMSAFFVRKYLLFTGVINSFLITGLVYSGVVAFLIYKLPVVFGLKENDVRSILIKTCNKIGFVIHK